MEKGECGGGGDERDTAWIGDRWYVVRGRDKKNTVYSGEVIIMLYQRCEEYSLRW